MGSTGGDEKVSVLAEMRMTNPKRQGEFMSRWNLGDLNRGTKDRTERRTKRYRKRNFCHNFLGGICSLMSSVGRNGKTLLFMLLLLLASMFAFAPPNIQPVKAIPTLNPMQVEFDALGQGIAVWTTEEAHRWTYSAKLMIPDGASVGSWADVKVPYGKTLRTLSPPSFSILYTTARPRFVLYLDKNGDGWVDSILLSDYLADGSGEWIIGTGGLRWGWTEATSPFSEWGQIWKPYEYWQDVYGNASVLYVAIALEYWAVVGNATFEKSGLGKPLYVDDITINGVTYILTATNIATLTIQVVGAGGQALSAPQVEIQNSAGTAIFNGLANEQGVVSIGVPYGTYTVNVNYKGFTNTASSSVNSSSGTVQTITTDVFIEFEPFGPMTFVAFLLWIIIVIVIAIAIIAVAIRKLLHH